MRRKPRWYRLLSSLLFAVLLFGISASAAGETASITVTYPLTDVEFRLYRAAEFSRSGVLTLTADFKDAKVSLEQLNQAAADTLALYAQRQKLAALDSGKTGRKGTLTFSGLESGLYLVVGESTVDDGDVYQPTPFLVLLSQGDEVTADPKYEKTPEPDDDDTVDRKVLKIWEDDGCEDQRPKRIRVELLRDGEVWDTVTLNAQNNWRYTWRDLDSRYTWRVVEKTVPDGYTVSVHREGITFVITNTYDAPEEPEVPVTPAPSKPPDIPDMPDVTDNREYPEVPKPSVTPTVMEKPALPQTGTLSWPVPVLACCGMLLFLAGWIRRQKEEDHED